MRKKKPQITHPRKRKHVRSDRDNQLLLKAKGRKLKAAIEESVIQAYLNDELLDADIPLLTLTELMERAGIKDETLQQIFEVNCHRYMKQALKAAIKQGIPGVMVTREFCNDVDETIYVVQRREKVLRSWVAGAGRGNKAAGILFVYQDDETACIMEALSYNHQVSIVNGCVERVKSHIEAASAARLPGSDSRSRHVKDARAATLLAFKPAHETSDS